MTENDFRRYCKAMSTECKNHHFCFCDKCEFMTNHGETNASCDAHLLRKGRIEEFIKRVDEWVEKHPSKTYIQDFFEKFPDAYRCVNGTPEPCRNYIYSRGNICPKDGECFKCWNEEMTE